MKTYQLILLSQAIALINCAVGIVVEVNNTFFHVNAPFTLSMVFNGLMLLFFCVKSARKRLGWRNNCWILLFTLTDVASNICIDYSYGYTNITSAILLSSLATPFSMLFSFFILKSRFSYEQIISSVVSLILAAAYTLIDAEMANSRVYGNLLAILGGGVGYGINTTINELIIKRGIDQYQIVSRLGAFGLVIASILAASLERHIYKTMKPAAAGMFFAYGAAKISFYMIQMYSITKTSAVFLNCSCLLTNFFTIFVSIFWLKINFHPNQIVPGMLLIFSIILFDISEGKQQDQKQETKQQSIEPIDLERTQITQLEAMA